MIELSIYVGHTWKIIFDIFCMNSRKNFEIRTENDLFANGTCHNHRSFLSPRFSSGLCNSTSVSFFFFIFFNYWNLHLSITLPGKKYLTLFALFCEKTLKSGQHFYKTDFVANGTSHDHHRFSQHKIQLTAL